MSAYFKGYTVDFQGLRLDGLWVQYLQCINNGDTTVLHYTIKLFVTLNIIHK